MASRLVPTMFGIGSLSKTQRLILGIFVLLLVDVIWVVSSELTKYLFQQKHFIKPYFSTYTKTCMFMVYLLGFLIWKSWRLQCKKNNGALQSDLEKEEKEDIGKPIYIPVKYDHDNKSSGTESDDSLSVGHSKRSVRFSSLSEVRSLPESHAEEAILARLSFTAYLRANEVRQNLANKLTVKQVAKIAGLFCVIYFMANLAYQEALKESESCFVKMLSSTAGLFTLILAAVFPSSSGDRFTLSKFVAVLISIGGVVLVSLSDRVQQSDLPLGALWSLCGAFMYAMYLVLVRRRADHEDKLNIPMFFGFVGFFTLLLLWPGFLMLHYSKAEQFEWPDGRQWLVLLVNGLIGTVLSELLWLWGCFLTSSLVATLSLSLTVPMTMIADLAINDVNYNWMFYVGTGPVFIAFFAVSVLSHYDNWDPVLLAFKKLSQCILRKRLIPRLRELDREQTESLIGINNSES